MVLVDCCKTDAREAVRYALNGRVCVGVRESVDARMRLCVVCVCGVFSC